MLSLWTPLTVCIVLIVATICTVIVLLVRQGRYDVAVQLIKDIVSTAVRAEVGKVFATPTPVISAPPVPIEKPVITVVPPDIHASIDAQPDGPPSH